MSEGEPQPRPQHVEVEISEFTDIYRDTWDAIWRTHVVVGLANQALTEYGVQLVPLWRGNQLESSEVRNLVDVPDRSPMEERRRISYVQAAAAVTDARVDEMRQLEAGMVDGVVGYRFSVPSDWIFHYIEGRIAQITNLASRPPEGERNGDTTN